jgi:RND superfamily putative drug exporter
MASRRADEAVGGPLARAYAWTVVALGPLLVPAWIALTVWAVAVLPSVASSPGASLNDLLPDHPRALREQEDSQRLFKLPLQTPFVVVQRDPNGLSAGAQGRALRRAARIDTGRPRANPYRLEFALPVLNAAGLVPGAREHDTTALTYLFFPAGTGAETGTQLSREYLASIPARDAPVGVTGSLPARLEQYRLMQSHLRLVEIATVTLIALVVGIGFRSLGAPLLTLLAAGVAFLVSQHGLGWIAQRADLTMPREITPIAVALILGTVTDDTVFLYAGTRRRLLADMRPREAVRAAMSQTTPIVLTAGLVVSCGVATLMLGTLGFFRSFGPGLAITVLAGLAVSLTLVPAVLALGGRVLFWPGLGETDRPPSDPTRGWRFRLAHLATARPAALVLAALAVAALVVPASGLVRTRLGIALVSSLPSDDPVRRAEAAAAQGFAAGIVAPTELLVRDARVGRRREALVRLQNLLAREDGVAAVLGPKQVPGNRRVGVVYAPRGGAARYAIVLSRPPTDARSIESLRRLQQRLPELLAQARLDGAQVEWGGETALGVEAVDSVRSSLWRIALAVLAVNFVFLAVFLRALAAPLYLLAASALAVAATFGLTTVVFQDVLGYDGLTYYIPLAAGVLLVSLGSDYNIFVVGRIWQEAGRRPVREAVAVAAPAAGRVITIAGLALAGSFALLALVPLDLFRVLAFSMAVGILLDSILVRAMLVPALVSLFRGRRFDRPVDRA